MKHSKAINCFRKRWKRREAFLSTCNKLKNFGNSIENQSKLDQIDLLQANSKYIGRSNSINCLRDYLRIDLFLAGVTKYVTYSDKLRDSSFEIRTSNGDSYVIQCSNEEISSQWYFSIKSTVDTLSNSFVCNFIFVLDVVYEYFIFV